MIVNGKEIADSVLSHLEQKVEYGKRVCFIQFGNDAASTAFIKRKKIIAERLKIKVDVLHEVNPLSTDWALQTLKEVIAKKYDGIVLQLPLPKHLNSELLLNAIPPEMDVDVLGSHMIGKYENGLTERMPPVAFAVSEILRVHKVKLENKKIVILGKGKLVGEPVMTFFKNKNLSYEAYDHTDNEHVKMNALKEADIVVTGIGQPHFVKPEMLKKGVVLIDAGTSEQAGKLAGDCDLSCDQVASVFSAVPGGVGPITVAGLFTNVFLD